MKFPKECCGPTALAQSTASGILKQVTVEPILFLFAFTSIEYPAVAALFYRKVCLMRINSSEICDNLGNSSYAEQEDEVQTEASHYTFYSQLCFSIPSIVTSLIYGQLSDRFSRKLVICVPLIGGLISTISYIINCTYMDLHVAYLLPGTLINGLSGGWMVLLVAIFGYLTEMTSTSSRTSRIAVVEAVLSLGFALPFFISGIVLDNTSYSFVFTISLVCSIVGILYTLLRLKEIDAPQNSTVKSRCKKLCEILGTTSSFRDIVTCFIRKREEGRRKFLLLLILLVFLAGLGYRAQGDLSFLFLKRRPFEWDQTTFGYYVGVQCAIDVVGQIVLVPLFKNKLHMRDTSILLIGLASGALSMILFGASTTTVMVFSVSFVGLPAGMGMTSLRSILSKLVAPDELGKSFAAIGFVQGVSGLLASALYNSLYPLTLSSWPGACFAVGAFIVLLPCGALSLWIHTHWNESLAYGTLSEEKDPTHIEPPLSPLGGSVDPPCVDGAACVMEPNQACLQLDFSLDHTQTNGPVHPV